MSPHVFDNIYLPATQVNSVGSYNTMVDIKLKHWAEKELPAKAIAVSHYAIYGLCALFERNLCTFFGNSLIKKFCLLFDIRKI